MTTVVRPDSPAPVAGFDRVPARRTRVGLVAGGLGTYWPQFPDLLPQLQASAMRVSGRMKALDCEVVDVGFISDAEDGARAAEKLRVAACDLIVGFLTTCMTASMLVPIAQRSGAPVLLINLQPTEATDHATFDTGQWLAYCGACPLPEMANAFLRCGIAFRSVSGYLEDERAWAKIGRWVKAAPRTSPSARGVRCCAASASTTANAAGACPSSSTSNPDRPPSSASRRSATAASASSPPQVRWFPDRCCGSATRRRGSGSSRTRGSGSTGGAPPGSPITGCSASATCDRNCVHRGPARRAAHRGVRVTGPVLSLAPDHSTARESRTR